MDNDTILKLIGSLVSLACFIGIIYLFAKKPDFFLSKKKKSKNEKI